MSSASSNQSAPYIAALYVSDLLETSLQVFSATFRTHCEACEIRPWFQPEPFRSEIFRAYHLRQALQPYIYTAGWKAHVTGVQTVRGMYYDFPEQEAAYNFSRMVFDNSYVTNPDNVSQQIQFSFGDDFFVSPVSRPLQTERQAQLAHPKQRRRRLDDERPFEYIRGTCCGPPSSTATSADACPPTNAPAWRTPAATYPTQTMEECQSSCDFLSGTSVVTGKPDCGAFSWFPYVNKTVPNCNIYADHTHSVVDTSATAKASGAATQEGQGTSAL